MQFLATFLTLRDLSFSVKFKSRMSNEDINKKLMFLIIVSVTIPCEWWLKLQLLLWLCVCNCSASLFGQATIFLELLKTSWAERLWKYLDSLMLYSRTPVPMRLLKKEVCPILHSLDRNLISDSIGFIHPLFPSFGKLQDILVLPYRYTVFTKFKLLDPTLPRLPFHIPLILLNNFKNWFRINLRDKWLRCYFFSIPNLRARPRWIRAANLELTITEERSLPAAVNEASDSPLSIPADPTKDQQPSLR